MREESHTYRDYQRQRYVKNTDTDKSGQIEKLCRVYKYPYTAMCRYIFAEANFMQTDRQKQLKMYGVKTEK